MQCNFIEPDDVMKILTVLRQEEYIKLKQEFDIYR